MSLHDNIPEWYFRSNLYSVISDLSLCHNNKSRQINYVCAIQDAYYVYFTLVPVGIV